MEKRTIIINGIKTICNVPDSLLVEVDKKIEGKIMEDKKIRAIKDGIASIESRILHIKMDLALLENALKKKKTN